MEEEAPILIPQHDRPTFASLHGNDATIRCVGAVPQVAVPQDVVLTIAIFVRLLRIELHKVLSNATLFTLGAIVAKKLPGAHICRVRAIEVVGKQKGVQTAIAALHTAFPLLKFVVG